MTFAERLRELRTTRGLTQRDVYTAIGASPIVYQRYEYGKFPAYEKLLSLADYFEVSLDYLTGRTDNPEINR
jgi:transcriptional regulator with XRE-family HTH domain